MKGQPEISDLDAMDLAIEWMDERLEEHDGTAIDNQRLDQSIAVTQARAAVVQARALKEISTAIQLIYKYM